MLTEEEIVKAIKKLEKPTRADSKYYQRELLFRFGGITVIIYGEPSRGDRPLLFGLWKYQVDIYRGKTLIAEIKNAEEGSGENWAEDPPFHNGFHDDEHLIVVGALQLSIPETANMYERP